MFTDQSRSVKSISLLAGSFTFAFLLGEMVHEFGHYFAHLAYGNLDIRVHLDPFGSSQIVGVSELSPWVLGVTSAAGPLLNLMLGMLSFVLFWMKRRSLFFPFLLWGPVALIQEGITFSLGLLTPGGDAHWVVAAGIPSTILLVIGITFLIASICLIAILLDLAAIKQDDPIGGKFFIIFTGTCSLMLIRCVHSFLAAQTALLENILPLVFSVVLAIILTILHDPITRVVGASSFVRENYLTWSTPALILALGVIMFASQLFLP